MELPSTGNVSAEVTGINVAPAYHSPKSADTDSTVAIAAIKKGFNSVRAKWLLENRMCAARITLRFGGGERRA